MPKILSRAELKNAIVTVLDSPEVSCAVAFWGKGGEALLGKRVQSARVICNLALGGTNPRTVKALMSREGVAVRQCDLLHAQTYIGQSGTVIASANASANGLGLEANEEASWIELGVYLQAEDDVTAARTWFDELWKNDQNVREISGRDLELAAQARSPSAAVHSVPS